MDADIRDAIVEEARRWIGTPYHHMADVLGVGVDCAMLPLRVYQSVGLIPLDVDPRPYPHDWMLHRSDERYLQNVERFASKVDEPLPGDIALFRIGRCLAHGAIVETPHMMIHAQLEAGRVVRREIVRTDPKLAGFWSMIHG